MRVPLETVEGPRRREELDRANELLEGGSALIDVEPAAPSSTSTPAAALTSLVRAILAKEGLADSDAVVGMILGYSRQAWYGHVQNSNPGLETVRTWLRCLRSRGYGSIKLQVSADGISFTS